MPYSVPPLPPPIVYPLPSEEITASAYSGISRSANSEPEFSSAARSSDGAADCVTGQMANCRTETVVGSATVERSADVAVRAELLGQPLEAGPSAYLEDLILARYGSTRLPELQAEAVIAPPSKQTYPDRPLQVRTAQSSQPSAPPRSESLPFPPAETVSPSPESENPSSPGEVLTIPGQPPTSAPESQAPPSRQVPAPGAPLAPGEPEVIELNADRQEYEQQQQVFRAQGNAVMRFREAVLSADRIQVNIPNRIAVAEGNVILTRGQQVLKGNRFEYNFVQGEGVILGAAGELFVPAAGEDLSAAPPIPVGTAIIPGQSTGDQVRAGQPLQVTGSVGGISINLAGGNQNESTATGGEINRVRYEAERVEFTSDGNLVATNVRLTNDPFSPPELEIRSPRVTYTRQSPTRSVLRARNPRVVFDQGFSLPLLRNQVVFDDRERNPGLAQFGFDERDRGGLFVERQFDVVNSAAVRFTLTPQILLQRAYDQGNFFTGSAYGLRSQLDIALGPSTTFAGEAVLTSLDLNKIEDNLRANVGLRQQIGRHTLSLGYTFRDRLFNGSLGFQNVQRSFGLTLESPRIRLGDTGIGFNYQASVLLIDANTDRLDLLPTVRENNRIDLTRYQASATLGRTFYLWTGTALPPTATQGLRYTPNPIVPYVAIGTSVRGGFNAYSNGDSQTNLTGTVELSGQLGHFSRSFLDYTAFRIAYSQTVLDGKSPFLFDRIADEQVLSLGLTQQLFGPFRVGVQTSINLDTSNTIDTIYTLEYSRRTYAISLTFSPVRQAASLNFRISDFNWSGDPGPFSGIGAPASR